MPELGQGLPLWSFVVAPAHIAGRQAAVAQLVEHRLPKPNVEGSNPFCRSNLRRIKPVSSYTQAYHAGNALPPPRFSASPRLQMPQISLLA
jgi:hypothetical protein